MTERLILIIPSQNPWVNRHPAPLNCMSQTPQIITHTFTSSARERLVEFLNNESVGDEKEIFGLTPDASTRLYFRIPWQRGTAIASVYPEPFDPEVHPFLEVTRLFTEANLPVPTILAVDAERGIIVQEDLGDRQLYDIFRTGSEEEIELHKEQAIALIAQIQSATELAQERRSISSRLAFDEAKLSWELGFFFENYFEKLRGEKLSHTQKAELKAELNDLAADLAARPRVLCHRDYHSSNLILDRQNRLRVIDYQDARMGPASYDLVSLLLDRQTGSPSMAEVRAHRLYFLEERRRLGLAPIDPDEFAHEFRLMTIQRILKAVGTFSYQTAVCGRGATYGKYIQPMLSIALQASEWLNRFPVLQREIKKGLDEEIKS
jgi:aminoglycoside/choline kinase family phosphotransferase